MMAVQQRLSKQAWILLSFFLLSCVGDPWPEPDTMENDDDNTAGDPSSDGDTEEVPGGDGDSDGDMDADTDADMDGDMDADADTDSSDIDKDTGVEDGADAGDEDAGSEGDTDGEVGDTDGPIPVDDMYAHLLDRLFVSAPDEKGMIVVGGLAGAIPSGRSARCFVEGVGYDVSLGYGRGFALQAAAVSGDLVSVVVEEQASGAETVVTVPVESDRTPADLGDFLGGRGGVTVINDSLLSIYTEGIRLEPDLLLVGVNLDRFETVTAPILCEGASCAAQIVIEGTPTDGLQLFLAPEAGKVGTAPVRVD